MDQELIAFLEARFRETNQQITELREETRQEIRQVYVVIEGLRHEVHLVADGVTANNERLDSFRAEVAQEFRDVRSLIHLSYKDLDRRIRRSDEDGEGLKIGTPG
ncbi:MAG: hypothetical protein ACJ76Y_20830 [Thermoanaerobaculia bacterium]